MNWFKGQPRWWVLVLALVCTIVAAVLAATEGPIWLVAVTVTLTFVGTEGVRFVNAALDRKEERTQLLRKATLGADWPLAGEVTAMGFGARKPLVDLAYRRRTDVEEKIKSALKSQEPVLLVGSSMVGKSRVAAEVLRREYPKLQLCRPAAPGGLAQLLEVGTPERCVIYLDDLERHLTANELRTDWLQQLTSEGSDNIVLATIRRRAMESFQSEGELRHPQARIVQDAFTIVELSDNPEGNAKLADSIDDPTVASGVRRYGVGPYLGGGRRAIGRYRDGQDSHPLGVAMIRTASDWRSLGLEDLSAGLLRRLAPEYLDPSRRHDLDETDDEALTWAKAREDDVVQLLEVTGLDRYLCSDYIHDQLAADRHDIPSIVWDAAAASTDGYELISVAWSAEDVGRLDLAISLIRQVVADGDPNWASIAALNLGHLEKKHGDIVAGRAAYQLAIDSGDADVVPMATIELGDLEREQGDVSAARVAYQQAIDSGHIDIEPAAAARLGDLEREQGDVLAARAAYLHVLGSGGADVVPVIVTKLGDLEREQGDVSAARVAYQQAMDSGHADWAPKAAIRQGDLERGQGHALAAREAYQQAIDSGDADIAPAGMLRIGILEGDQGNISAARQANQQIIDSGDAVWGTVAALSLGILESKQGNVSAARMAYQRAIDFGQAYAAAKAATRLGDLEWKQGNVPAARMAYQLAIASPDASEVPVAAVRLGDLEGKQGNVLAARAAYEQAIDSAHAHWTPVARAALQRLATE